MQDTTPFGEAEARSFLVAPLLGQHFAQMHRDVSGLTRSVALFAESGLRQGARMVLFVTPATHDALRLHLAERGFITEELERSAQLTFVDVHAALDRFMLDGVPDWAEAHRTFAEVMEESHDFRSGGTRVYSELATFLWHRGAEQAAITLEEFQNVLAHYYPFALFCGHKLDAYDPRLYAGALRELGRTHDHIIPSADDIHFRAAIDAASRHVFGTPLTEVLKRHPLLGSERLPVGQRTVLWVMHNSPAKAIQLLENAREYENARAESPSDAPAWADSGRTASRTDRGDPVQHAGKPVLIVDDDDDFRDSLVELLEGERFQVEAASSAPEALRMLRGGLRPSLILLDLQMDEMNGWEFRAEQKRFTELAGLPVVVVTASRWKDQDFADFDGCIRKPLGFEDLKPALLRYCG
jgi:CheY-like chemotaxis protein